VRKVLEGTIHVQAGFFLLMPHELWDPHAGLKPSELDSHISDADMEMEEDLPPGGEKEVHGSMVEMMVNLEQHNDGEWLPPRLQKRTTARKTGVISSAGRQRCKRLTGVQKNERLIPMALTSLQNQHEHNDTWNTFRQ
jgi:hypothetical protein